MVSLWRTIRNVRRVGLREWARQMLYIGDAKAGTYVGADQFGNRYFENMNAEEEIPGRHRWIDFAQHEYNASQVPPEWHSWLQHIRKDPPTADPIMQESKPRWQARHMENLTGTRAAYKPYSTTNPKVFSWQPKIQPRSQ